METLLSQYSFHQKFLGIDSTIFGLSKHLFLVQKDLGLCYIPATSVVLSSLSYSLTGLEFEHEQLAALKLLSFLIDWKYENGTFPNIHNHKRSVNFQIQLLEGLGTWFSYFSNLKLLCFVSYQ
jgi:hypothetical protein